jgi:hypothetical protein
MTITPIQTYVTGKTAIFQGAGVDVSGIISDWTLKIQVGKLTAGKNVRFQFTDSADNFVADKAAGATYSFTGEIGNTADVVNSLQSRDSKKMRIGVASCKLRLEITGIDAGASVDYSAWLESA